MPASGPQIVSNAQGTPVEADPVYDPISAPIVSLKAVVPSDSVDLPDGVCRCLFIGGDGNISIVAEDDGVTPQVLKGWTAGSMIPIRAKRVFATGTTATFIIAGY